MREPNTTNLQSRLLPLARAIATSLEQCRVETDRTGLVHEAWAQLMRKRAELALCTPDSRVDALVLSNSLQTMAGALANCDLEELGPESIKCAVLELWSGLENLSLYLEGEAGITANALGLDRRGSQWQ